MKKKVIGYIHSDRGLTKEDKLFLKIIRKNNCEAIFFNLLLEINENELEEKIKKCDIFFNNSSEDFAIEFVKTIENLGKKVIDSSKTFFEIEDKWVFYLKCKKHKIPVPDTILLSENLSLIKNELKKFNHWPVILKRIEGTCGDYVDKADNTTKALEVIKKFWRKGGVSPIIAQEYIKSDCYRVTVIDKKISQTAVKQSLGWKATGVYANKIKKFKIDKRLLEIIDKLIKISNIKVMGIDILKKDDKWLALEINSDPGLDFFPLESEKLIEKIVKLLIKEIK